MQLDPVATYTVGQAGVDIVIDMDPGNQKILVSVQMSALTGNRIFEG